MSRAAEREVLAALAAFDAELAGKVEVALEEARLADAYRHLGSTLLKHACKATAKLPQERPERAPRKKRAASPKARKPTPKTRSRSHG